MGPLPTGLPQLVAITQKETMKQPNSESPKTTHKMSVHTHTIKAYQKFKKFKTVKIFCRNVPVVQNPYNKRAEIMLE